MGSRPRVAVVATAWTSPETPNHLEWDEPAWITRRVAAALAMEADVEVILLDGGRPGSFADGAFTTVTRLPSPRPDRLRAALLLKALSAGVHAEAQPGLGTTRPTPAVPGPVQAHLRALAGGTSPQLVTHLAGSAPDAVVVAGYRHSAAELVLAPLPRPRTVLLPLALDDLELRLPVHRPVLQGASVMLATSEWEHRLLADHLSAEGSTATVHQLGLALDDPGSGGTCLGRPEWLGTGPYLVVMAPPSSGPAPAGAVAADETLLALLAGRFPDLSLVVVTAKARCRPEGGPAATPGGGQAATPGGGQAATPGGGPASTITVVTGRHRQVRPGMGLGQLGRVMAGAWATVELRSGQVLAREVLLSLIAGTPALVPEASGPARAHVGQAEGGLWYRDRRELVTSVARVLQPEVRDALGNQGRRWARRAHGRRDEFVATTRRAALAARPDPPVRQGPGPGLADR